MTDTSELAVVVEADEDQVWRASERTELHGPSRRTAMCDAGRRGELKEWFESQGSMQVLLKDGCEDANVSFVADLVGVYLDDEWNMGVEDGVAPWAGSEGDESWCESDWKGQASKTVYVIRNCIPIDPIPISSLRKQNGAFLNGESTACAIVQKATVVPLWEPPRYALGSEVVAGSFAIKTSADIEKVAKRTKRDGPDAKTAIVDGHLWQFPKTLLAEERPVRVYFANSFSEGAHITHVAELVDAIFGDAYETEGKAALKKHGLSGDADVDRDFDTAKTVYIVKNCHRVRPFRVDKLVKREGSHADGENLRYTIVKEQELTAWGGPARQEETNVEPLKLRTVPTSATQDSDAETDPPLPGEQDMSTATDGAKTKVIVNKYERNPKNRKKCIEAHGGPQCQVCEMMFEEVYGVHGAGYIHVHHVTPLSEIGEAHEPNPFRDLKPVCPNCHAMLHRQKPDGTYLELEELRVLLRTYRASSELSIIDDLCAKTSRASSLPPPGEA